MLLELLLIVSPLLLTDDTGQQILSRSKRLILVYKIRFQPFLWHCHSCMNQTHDKPAGLILNAHRHQTNEFYRSDQCNGHWGRRLAI